MSESHCIHIFTPLINKGKLGTSRKTEISTFNSIYVRPGADYKYKGIDYTFYCNRNCNCNYFKVIDPTISNERKGLLIIVL